jgi:hypothetical protein
MLSEDIRQALIKVEKEKPRNAQVLLGPSDLGGCREYARNVLAGSPMQDAGDVWPAAAVIGTEMGDAMERAVRDHMGASVQKSITTLLPNGLMVTGTADMIFEDRNALADCKTKDGLAEVRRYGPSLENKIQVSIYTLGCVQNGYLTEGATAHLIYLDRSGNEQTLHEVVMTWDEIEAHIELCCQRLDDVIKAQEAIDAGDVTAARSLRDKTPPFCYSPKVMCPFRDLCWEGSEWVPDEKITDEAVVESVHRYVEARDEVNASTERKEFFRGELIGVSGITPDGYAVTWPGSGKALYVTKVKGKGNDDK